MLGPMEWLLVGGIAVLVFGPQLFVKAAKGVGEGVGEFKKAMAEGEKAAEETGEEAEEKKAPASP